MKKISIKSKTRHFSRTGNSLEIIDWGYNDFKYIEPLKTPRYINNYLLHYVVKGSGTLNYGDKTYAISEKDVFCLVPDVLLSYYPDEGNPWRYFWINFEGVEGEELVKAMGFSKDCPIKKATMSEEVLAIFENILSSSISQKEAYYKVKSALFALVSTFCENKHADEFIKSSDLVQRVKEILTLNYKNASFSIEVLCDIMHVSHSYICRLFKQQTGQTVVKALIDLRLLKSVELLSGGEYLVKDLASLVGFNDELHFMKEFKKKFGVTVKQYRKQFVKNDNI